MKNPTLLIHSAEMINSWLLECINKSAFHLSFVMNHGVSYSSILFYLYSTYLLAPNQTIQLIYKKFPNTLQYIWDCVGFLLNHLCFLFTFEEF